MSEQVLLNITDPQIIGIHMRTLIDLWVEHGLADYQRDALERAQAETNELEDKFAEILELDRSWYNQVFDKILMNLNYWEELPAWQEVCLLKGYHDRVPNFAQSVSPSTKRYTLIMIEVYLQKIHGDRQASCGREPEELVPYFWQMSTWYQSMFHRYQDRQFSRMYSLEYSMRASLASGDPLYITIADDVYPSSWIQALKAWAEPEEQMSD